MESSSNGHRKGVYINRERIQTLKISRENPQKDITDANYPRPG
jgi:hypothetical protein